MKKNFRARLNYIVFVSLFTDHKFIILVQIKIEEAILQPWPHKGLVPLPVGLKIQTTFLFLFIGFLGRSKHSGFPSYIRAVLFVCIIFSNRNESDWFSMLWGTGVFSDLFRFFE